MKQILLTLCFTIFTLWAVAQKFNHEFTKIGKDEIELEVYPEDKDAEAVVLFDKAKSYFERVDNGFDLVFERTTRIKILKDAGIKWAEVNIPLYQDGGIFETVTDLEAYTYNYEDLQLKRIAFDPKNVYEEKINNHWIQKKFALPQVKKGSVIEYRYKVSSQYLFNLHDWEFQWKIPVEYSEYEVRLIPFYEYTHILIGATKFDEQKSYVDKGVSRQFRSINYQDMIHQYVMKKLPAFKDEEFITSPNDYLIKLDFQLSKIHRMDGSVTEIMTTWKDLIKKYQTNSSFGKFVKKTV